MLHQSLLIPQDASHLALAIACSGVAAGAALWIAGARFSRGILTLSAVALGTYLGKQLPGWMDWPISGMGPGVAAALALGVAAYALHRFFASALLCLLLCCAAALGTTYLTAAPEWWSAWSGPVATLWQNLPENTRKIGPLTVSFALLTGLGCALRFPRIGLALLYSLLGVFLLVPMGVCALELGSPQWLVHLPAGAPTQALGVLGMVALGAVIQWSTLRPAPAPAAHDDDDGDVYDD